MAQGLWQEKNMKTGKNQNGKRTRAELPDGGSPAYCFPVNRTATGSQGMRITQRAGVQKAEQAAGSGNLWQGIPAPDQIEGESG
jgi:hypothetical protein